MITCYLRKDLPLGQQPLIAAAEGRITLRLNIDLRSSALQLALKLL
jgi:hypothetical protein